MQKRNKKLMKFYSRKEKKHLNIEKFFRKTDGIYSNADILI